MVDSNEAEGGDAREQSGQDRSAATERLTYARGIATGVSVTAASILLLMAAWIRPQFARTYEMFRGAELPTLTSLTLSPVWGFGVPILLVLVTVGVHRLRPGRTRTAIVCVVATLGLVLVLFTIWSYYLPIFPLAPGIRGAGTP